MVYEQLPASMATVKIAYIMLETATIDVSSLLLNHLLVCYPWTLIHFPGPQLAIAQRRGRCRRGNLCS